MDFMSTAGVDTSPGQPDMLALCEGMGHEQLTAWMAALQKMQAQKKLLSKVPTQQCVVAQFHAIDSEGNCEMEIPPCGLRMNLKCRHR
jgi:hypothetical protein